MESNEDATHLKAAALLHNQNWHLAQTRNNIESVANKSILLEHLIGWKHWPKMLFWLPAIRSLLLPVWGRKYLQQRSPSSGKHDLQFRLGWKSWKQSAELIAATQRPPTRNQNAPNFLHLNYWLVRTNCSLQIIAEDLFLLATLVYLTFLPFHKIFVPEAISYVLPKYIHCTVAHKSNCNMFTNFLPPLVQSVMSTIFFSSKSVSIYWILFSPPKCIVH